MIQESLSKDTGIVLKWPRNRSKRIQESLSNDTEIALKWCRNRPQMIKPALWHVTGIALKRYRNLASIIYFISYLKIRRVSNPTQPNPTQPKLTQPNPTQPNPTQHNPTQPNPTHRWLPATDRIKRTSDFVGGKAFTHFRDDAFHRTIPAWPNTKHLKCYKNRSQIIQESLS